MHGLIFATLEEYVREEHHLELPTTHDRTAAYDDAEFTRLVEYVARETETPVDEILRGLGRYAGRVAFARLFPDYYARAGGTREFLLPVEDKIHEVVRATIPQAAPPHLTVMPLGKEGVIVSYTSPRALCALLEGVIEGTAAYYGESFRLDQPSCMQRGDLACSVVVERV